MLFLTIDYVYIFLSSFQTCLLHTHSFYITVGELSTFGERIILDILLFGNYYGIL